jgi:hypothetical protein
LIVSVKLTIYLTPVNVPTNTEAITGTNIKFFLNNSAIDMTNIPLQNF